jgi:hypothetical protein
MYIISYNSTFWINRFGRGYGLSEEKIKTTNARPDICTSMAANYVLSNATQGDQRQEKY